MSDIILTTRATGLRELRAAFANGRVNCVDFINRTLSIARQSVVEVNALATVCTESALTAAIESEHRYATGTARLLEGLPIGVKDLVDTHGIETRYGSPAYIGHIPTADADVVRTLVDQGAIIIGKTTTHEFAWGVTTASDAFGDTLNPLDNTRIPGGSSGGGAAAIAYGVVAAGIGTDTGGSVRIPAALCGVVGFKPTFGTLPTKGIFPLAPSLDHPGLMGASVGDVELLAAALGIRGGSMKRDASPRFGVINQIESVPLSTDVELAIKYAISTLQREYACENIDTTGLFEGAFQAFAGIVLAEGGMTHFARNDWEFIASHYGSETVDRLDRARKVALSEYAHCQQIRRQVAARLTRAMNSYDYLLVATCPCIAPQTGKLSVNIGSWSGTIREALMTYTAPFNMAGFPAISIPLPMQGNHLPAALQIIGRPGDDRGLIQIALTIEEMVMRTGVIV